MFTQGQLDALAAPLNRSNVKTRKQSGRNLSYLEAWRAIEEANRIFGFDGWTSETVETRMVNESERLIGDRKEKGWSVSYVGRVKIVVFAGDTLVTREGIGAGHGIDRDLGQAHESAIKECESDARKRALMTFGYPLGLALYDKEQTNVTDDRTYEQNEKTIDQWADRRSAELSRAAKQPEQPALSETTGTPTADELANMVVYDEELGRERPALASDFEATTGVLKATYLDSARDLIRKAISADALRAWWFSPESQQARTDFELTAMELKDLSQFCKAKIDKLKGVA